MLEGYCHSEANLPTAIDSGMPRHCIIRRAWRIAKDFGHAPTACKGFNSRAYEEPCWHYESQKTYSAQLVRVQNLLQYIEEALCNLCLKGVHNEIGGPRGERGGEGWGFVPAGYAVSIHAFTPWLQIRSNMVLPMLCCTA